jgi:hypothetical protein
MHLASAQQKKSAGDELLKAKIPMRMAAMFFLAETAEEEDEDEEEEEEEKEEELLLLLAGVVAASRAGGASGSLRWLATRARVMGRGKRSESSWEEARLSMPCPKPRYCQLLMML